MSSDILLRVEGLRKFFTVKRGFPNPVKLTVKAVDDVSFEVRRRESFGLVGESGCGKSTVGRSVLRLVEPDAGRILLHGKDILPLDRSHMQELRRKMQIIFQDPYSSLNPRRKIGRTLAEPLQVHRMGTGGEIRAIIDRILEDVGLSPESLDKFPHEFSGGQRQRVGIARALAVNPKLIIADEPISALDVSIQAQVINLLEDLQDQFNLTYLFIAHDLRVVEQISDRVAVMYLGKIVELADSQELYAKPMHPYTEALLSAIPIPDPTTKRRRIILEGDPPSPINPPKGCRFHTRCHKRFDRCDKEEPVLREVDPRHWVSCHLY